MCDSNNPSVSPSECSDPLTHGFPEAVGVWLHASWSAQVPDHCSPGAQLEGLSRSQSWACSPSLAVVRCISDIRGHLEARTLWWMLPLGVQVFMCMSPPLWCPLVLQEDAASSALLYEAWPRLQPAGPVQGAGPPGGVRSPEGSCCDRGCGSVPGTWQQGRQGLTLDVHLSGVSSGGV